VLLLYCRLDAHLDRAHAGELLQLDLPLPAAGHLGHHLASCKACAVERLLQQLGELFAGELTSFVLLGMPVPAA
jgi:hypothetical protein